MIIRHFFSSQLENRLCHIRRLFYFFLIFFAPASFALDPQVTATPSLTSCALLTETLPALSCYQSVVQSTSNTTTRRITLFKVAKLQLSLDEYEAAAHTYQTLLASNLDPVDTEIALEGWVNSMSFNDKPIAAYNRAKKHTPFHQPGLVIATARAALWANYPYQSKNLLNEYAGILNNVEANTRLGSDLQTLRLQTYAQTADYIFNVTSRYETDSDFQSLTRQTLQLVRNWNENNLSVVTADQAYYQQPGLGHVIGNLLQLRHQIRFTPYTLAEAGISSGDYAGWRPVFWQAAVVVRPNDNWAGRIYGNRSVVESLIAVQQETTATTFGLSASRVFPYHIRGTGEIYHTQFNDNNQRNGLFAEASYLLTPRYGITLLGRARYYHDSNTNTQGYFNPNSFQEEDVLVRWRQQIRSKGNWYVTTGPGLQTLNPGGVSPILLIEAGINYMFTKHVILHANAGYTNSNYTSSSGYTRKYGEVSLEIPF